VRSSTLAENGIAEPRSSSFTSTLCGLRTATNITKQLIDQRPDSPLNPTTAVT